ncbi:MAG: hypothetical protein ACREIT_04040 [Tepidisphaeraceae bacterium]
MKPAWKSLFLSLVAPACSVAVLGAVVAENSRHVKPENVEPYHRWARQAIGLQVTKIGVEDSETTHTASAEEAIAGQVPFIIDTWTGREDQIPAAAQQLLKPNAILSRTYVDNDPAMNHYREAAFLIVQCRDSRDMIGHYPPICYKAHGEKMEGPGKQRKWQFDDLPIHGMEYEFSRHANGRTYKRIVYNFLIVPGRQIVPDMDGLLAASEYRYQRYYGAAQFQLVMSAQLPREERDEIFKALIGRNINVIRGLLNPRQAMAALPASDGKPSLARAESR